MTEEICPACGESCAPFATIGSGPQLLLRVSPARWRVLRTAALVVGAIGFGYLPPVTSQEDPADRWTRHACIMLAIAIALAGAIRAHRGAV